MASEMEHSLLLRTVPARRTRQPCSASEKTWTFICSALLFHVKPIAPLVDGPIESGARSDRDAANCANKIAALQASLVISRAPSPSQSLLRSIERICSHPADDRVQ